MNVEKLLLWADYIEALPHVSPNTEDDDVRGFNLEDYVFDCGTPACIAGHVAAGAYPDINLRETVWFAVKQLAARELGLAPEQAQELFSPTQLNVWSAATPTQAAACMRHLAATGVVDWPHALKENK